MLDGDERNGKDGWDDRELIVSGNDKPSRRRSTVLTRLVSHTTMHESRSRKIYPRHKAVNLQGMNDMFHLMIIRSE